MTTRKLSPRRFQYGGLSTLRADDSLQQLLLVGDQGRAGPQADVRIHQPVVLREALTTLLELISKGYGYTPSSPEVGAEAQEGYESWRKAAPGMSPIQARQQLHSFLAESDPDAWLVMDPVVTIQEDAIIFEVFDKRARTYAALTLKATMFSGELTPGTVHIETGRELLEDLALVHGRAPLQLKIGAGVAADLDEAHQGALVKSFTYPLSWQRQLLQLLAAATLPGERVPLARVDLFNILRYLRLNREQKGDPKALRFALVPGEVPEITIEPWEWRYTCTGQPYAGGQSKIIGLWERREALALQRILPHVQQASVQILGEAQPTFWTLDCGDFSFTLATPGFRPMNWSRGLMMDIHIPRHTPDPEGYDTWLAALSRQGAGTLAALAGAAGLTMAQAAAALRRGCQSGQVYLDPSTEIIRHRPLFGGDMALDVLRFRSGQEGKAWRLVEQGRVEKRITQRPTGEVGFVGPPLPGKTAPEPSTVTEPRHPFQEREPQFTPKLELNRSGATRKPGCTCTYWKRQSASTKSPCAHLQALWLRHCMDVVEEQALEKTDPGRIKVRNSTLVKRRADDELVHEVSLMFRRLTETWGTRRELRDQSGRRQVLIFASVGDARDAFFARCAALEQSGFLNASK